MGLFSGWSRSRGDASRVGSGKKLEEQLEELESASRRVRPGSRGTHLNRAGDLCLKAGDRDRALQYYGRAIDTYLEDEQAEAARGMAKKLIRAHPRAVRTLCTLTWLDLGARYRAVAVTHLKEYVRVAREASRRELAGGQIMEMARTSTDEAFLAVAAEGLEELGFPGRAARVREWAEASGSPDAVSDPEELMSRCLEAARKSNAFRKAEGALG